MEKLYICHTPYHLLIALAKMELKDENKVWLADTIPEVEQFNQCLKNSFLVSHSEVIRERPHPRNAFSIEETCQVYIFNDCTFLGIFLRKQGISYTLIEESLDYYSYQTQWRSVGIKYKILWRTVKRLSPFGHSNLVKKIEVNDISKVAFRDGRINKLVEVPRENLFANLSESHRLELQKIFKIDERTRFNSKSVLILTQPLYQDNWDENIKSLSEQEDYYYQLCDFYMTQGFDVYIKPHPRDLVDYTAFEGVYCLKKEIPMEIYDVVGKYHFSKAVTHSSTAIEFLSCVDEKITLVAMR